MKFAITCEKDEVFQHFGHTPEFAVYEAQDGKIISESRKSSGGSGHEALAGLLAEDKIQALICGGIGGGAINALTEAGIKVIGGASGNVREVAEAYVNGTLLLRPDFFCRKHEGEHQCHCHGGSCH